MDPRSQSNYKGAMMDCKKCVTHNGRSQVDHECFRDFPNPELVSSSEKTMSLSSEQSDERLDLKTNHNSVICQARSQKFCKVVDIDSTNRLYIPCHTIPYLS